MKTEIKATLTLREILEGGIDLTLGNSADVDNTEENRRKVMTKLLYTLSVDDMLDSPVDIFFPGEDK
jgi:hypothetical protein